MKFINSISKPTPSVIGRITCVIVAAGILIVNTGIKAASDPEALEREFKEIIANVEKLLARVSQEDREAIHNILRSFQRNTRYTHNWGETLAKIELRVPWNLFFDLPSNAIAQKIKTGQRHVRLNQPLLFQIHDKSYAAARYLVKESCGIPLRDTANSVTDHLGVEIKGHVIAWVLAHELAHHLAGNVNAKPKTLAQSRKWELNADKTAFDILNHAGFSLYLLSRYMQTMESLEQIKKRVGQVTPEELSNHPLWSTRRSALQHYMDTHPPVDHRWMIYSWLSFSPGENRLTHPIYLLPRNRIEHTGIFVLASGSIAMVGVDRRPDNCARVYFRDKNLIWVHEIEDTSKHVTTLNHYGKDGSKISKLCFRDSFAGTMAFDPTDLIRDALAYDPITRITEVLKSELGNPDLRREAEDLFIRRTESIHEHLLDFYRGALSPEQLQVSISSTSLHYETRIKRILGVNKFNRINKVLLNDPASLILRRLN
jgi:hypothetical protein